MNHKDKPTKEIKIPKGVLTVYLSLSLSLSLAYFSSLVCDCFLFLPCVCDSQLSMCFAAVAAGSRIRMVNFVLEPDTWEADSSCRKFKHTDRHNVP